MPTKITRLVPGYSVKNRVAIYGGAHASHGPTLWQGFTFLIEQGYNAWLEYGQLESWEDWEGPTLVEVEQAHILGRRL